MVEAQRPPETSHGVQGVSYFSDRELHNSAGNWVLLAALGVAYVIAGEFAAWNYGIALAGWGGMMLGLILMAGMYVCLTFSLAELAAIIPTAGGGYGFARRAFGPGMGFLTGMAIVFEYSLATAAVSLFFEGYFSALTGIGGLAVIGPFYALFLVIHICGARESLRMLLVMASIAATGLLIFILAMALKFDPSNLTDIPIGDGKGASALLPHGYGGIWASLPFAMAMFLAVEGIPLASEEATNPKHDVPLAMKVAIVILLVIAVAILVTAPGGAGASRLGEGEDPLMIAFTYAYSENNPLRYAINIAAILGIAASFFSLIFAFSRQVFSLSRAGYLPRFLSLTNRRKAPIWAVLLPGLVSFALSLTGNADNLIIIVVFCATLSYILMMSAHVALRLREPTLSRPYRTPGGLVTSSLALLLSLFAFSVCLSLSLIWSLIAASCLALCMAYYGTYSRHRLVAGAPEEEFAIISAANEQLDH